MDGYVEKFSDLRIYQAQRLLSRNIFALTRTFPADEKYSLTDQISRSSRSIGAQIAEAWGKRLYPKHFISKLSDADSEQLETQHWLNEALDCQYITAETHSNLISECESIGKMLGSMIKKAEAFTTTSNNLKEPDSLYDVFNSDVED